MLINGQLTPLLYADNGQLVGVVPMSLPVNSSQQIVPLRDAIYGIPSPVIIAATQPAVFVKGGARAMASSIRSLQSRPSGGRIPNPAVWIGRHGHHLLRGSRSVDGQGLVSNPVAVSIGGQSAQILYAGTALAGSFPAEGPPSILGVSTGLGGLYQVTITVPGGVWPAGQPW